MVGARDSFGRGLSGFVDAFEVFADAELELFRDVVAADEGFHLAAELLVGMPHTIILPQILFPCLNLQLIRSRVH